MDAHPAGVACVYAPEPQVKRPISHLAGFTGILQVDHGADAFDYIDRCRQ